MIGPFAVKCAREVIVMQAALRVQTTILPGHRIEISAPELPEGDTVEVIVLLPARTLPPRRSLLEWLDSLPPGPRSYSTWEEVEQHLQEERDAWER
jgi:hypothetical protein